MGKRKPTFTPTPPCCDVWPEIADVCVWFHPDNGEPVRLMPCLRGAYGERLRVNHCPSCGAERRSTVEEVRHG